MFDELCSEITEEMWPFRSQIADREQVRAALAIAEQKRIGAANRRLERVFMDGIGAVMASISPDVYHRFGLLYGYETVNSPDFLKSLLRHNEDMRVHSRSAKTFIVVPEWEREGYPQISQRAADLGSSADVCTEAQPIETGEIAA